VRPKRDLQRPLDVVHVAVEGREEEGEKSADLR
jgi:hypothetical protein